MIHGPRVVVLIWSAGAGWLPRSSASISAFGLVARPDLAEGAVVASSNLVAAVHVDRVHQRLGSELDIADLDAVRAILLGDEHLAEVRQAERVAGLVGDDGEEVDEAIDTIKNGGKESTANKVDDAMDEAREGAEDAKDELKK